ncbi:MULTISPECIES: hypothetical protein [Streptomyces]|nr:MULTISPECIES: hypothetical protein [Streptomyces]WCL83556.1 hypothetical protein PPN52_02345 [Streptomyces sp. JCM 35825]
MSINDKLAATNEEVIIAEAEAEVAELSDHERPMVVGVINEA